MLALLLALRPAHKRRLRRLTAAACVITRAAFFFAAAVIPLLASPRPECGAPRTRAGAAIASWHKRQIQEQWLDRDASGMAIRALFFV